MYKMIRVPVTHISFVCSPKRLGIIHCPSTRNQICKKRYLTFSIRLLGLPQQNNKLGGWNKNLFSFSPGGWNSAGCSCFFEDLSPWLVDTHFSVCLHGQQNQNETMGLCKYQNVAKSSRFAALYMYQPKLVRKHKRLSSHQEENLENNWETTSKEMGLDFVCDQ